VSNDASNDPEALLLRAQALHAAGDINGAIELAHQALARDRHNIDTLVYLGTTLVTRRLAFEDGLALLERAYEDAPDDPGLNYSLGWCYEFVAYRLEKDARRPYRDPVELYELAARHLQRCIDLNPDQGLKEDAQDLLDSILNRL
jgi:tetratricopeptide (TPR) repeat protein